jgi:hypothetical protein
MTSPSAEREKDDSVTVPSGRCEMETAGSRERLHAGCR